MTIVLITHDEDFGQRAPSGSIRMQDGRIQSDRANTSAPPQPRATVANVLRGPVRAKSILPPFMAGRRTPLTPDVE